MSNTKLVKEIEQVYSKVPIKVDVGRLQKALDKGIRQLNKVKKESVRENVVKLQNLPDRVPYADTTIKSSVPLPASDTELVSSIQNINFYDKRNKLQSKIRSIERS
jgi:hypothetical protein